MCLPKSRLPLSLLVIAAALVAPASAATETPAPLRLSNGIVIPYPVTRVFRGYDDCRFGRHRHRAIDLGGVGPDQGLGTPIVSMVKAKVTMIGSGHDSPAKFGTPDKRKGKALRGRQKLPRSKKIPGYGKVYFFTKNHGKWRSGTVIATVGMEKPFKGYKIRYLHLGAVRPDLKVGDIVEAGEEIGVMGGTAVQTSGPHVHIDVRNTKGTAIDVAPLLGLQSTWYKCPKKGRKRRPHKGYIDIASTQLGKEARAASAAFPRAVGFGSGKAAAEASGAAAGEATVALAESVLTDRALGDEGPPHDHEHVHPEPGEPGAAEAEGGAAPEPEAEPEVGAEAEPEPEAEPEAEAPAEAEAAAAPTAEPDPDPEAEPEVEVDGKIWRRRAPAAECGYWSRHEDFKTGRFRTHEVVLELEPHRDKARPWMVAVTKVDGGWAPRMVLKDAEGVVLYDGRSAEVAALKKLGLKVRRKDSGRGGDRARIEIDTSKQTEPVQLTVEVDAWAKRPKGMKPPKSAAYVFELNRPCRGSKQELMTRRYRGLHIDGAFLPRAGLRNKTLSKVKRGQKVEKVGRVVVHEGREMVLGKVSWFGGPDADPRWKNGKTAISREKLASLNRRRKPSKKVRRVHADKYYYAAMRVGYEGQSRRWWKKARLLVENPETGDAVVVRLVDWGPHPKTGRLIDISPQALKDLGLSTDDEVLVSFARPNAPLGPLK